MSYRSNHRPLYGLISLLWLLISFCPGLALAQMPMVGNGKPSDIVILQDTSASLLETDPNENSPSAIEMFLNLLGPDDRVALVGFDADVHYQSGFRAMTPPQQKELANTARKLISHYGAYTNFHAPLGEALRLLGLDRRPDARAGIVLFSDGMLDLGDPEQNQRLTDELNRHELPALQAANLPVMTLAFSNMADMRFLREVARKTGGIAEVAHSSEELNSVFTRFFEFFKQPDMLPVTNGRIKVDNQVQQLTLMLDHPKDRQISLRTPQGERLRADVATPGVTWMQDQNYSLVKLDKPQAGEWRVETQSREPQRAYIETDLQLCLNPPETIYARQLPVRIQAWFEKNRERVLPAELKQLALDINGRIDAQGSQQVRHSLDFSSEDSVGNFTTELPILAPGIYRIDVQAQGKDLQRQRQQTLTVLAEGERVPAPSVPMTTKPDLRLSTKPGSLPPAETPSSSVKTSPPPAPAEKLEDKPSNLTEIIVQLLLVNILIVLIGGGVYAYRRYVRDDQDDL